MKQNIVTNPSWWKRRNGTEKLLVVLASVAVLIAIGFAIALGVVVVKYNTKETNSNAMPEALVSVNGPRTMSKKVKNEDCDGDICTSKGCVNTASDILNNMDKSVDPCDDFYEFACGNFLKKTRIPDDKTSVNTFSIIGDELTEQIRALLDKAPEENEAKPFVLARNLYTACMNKSLIEQRGTRPLIEILRKLGGWPLLDGDSWDEASFTWKNSVYRFRRSGYSVDYFIDFSVGVDVKNSTTRIIDVDQASLGLSREFLNKGLTDKLVKAYYEYMVDISVLLGANRENAEKELLDSLNFEIKLANISLPLEQRRNATKLYNPMTVGELQEKFPSIPWLEYINTLLSPFVTVNDEEVVIVNVPSYLTKLEELLSKTPKRVQANYVMWRVAGASVSYLNDELRKRQLQFATALSGKSERESRWKECVETVGSSLSLAIGSLYVKKYFNEESKHLALEMVAGIREEFKNILQNVEWMDEHTRAAAIDKAESMSTHIAYPSELLDTSKLVEFYSGLEMSPDKYIESVLNLTYFGTEYSFKQLRNPVNKSEWISHGRPAIVNAFYSSTENSIQFPAGILQGAFFSSQRPKYMNYGAIGFVIGHEITHGFDDQGRQFDKNGNLVDWWDSKTKENYLERAKCIIDQYSNYTASEVGLNLNGVNTQGENIADNGGIKEAYLAYQKWVSENEEEPRLPGLDFSPQQMFWISAANTWCSVYRPESLKLRITTGFHSPGKFRVIGPLSNMDYFADDFNCPEGSKMNPVKKCKVW